MSCKINKLNVEKIANLFVSYLFQQLFQLVYYKKILISKEH